MKPAFTDEERGVLSDLLEAGVASTAEKIGQMSSANWDVVSSSIRELSASQALAMWREETGTCFGARLKSRSLLPMEVVILFPEASGRQISAAAAKAGSPRMKTMPDRDKVILGEISNILGQGIIKALIDTFGISVILTVPQMVEGRRAEILAAALSDFDEKSETLLLSHVQMNSPEISAECGMLLVFDTAVLKRLLEIARDR